MTLKILTFLIAIVNTTTINPELIIGKEKVEPGIIFIFEGAVKDKIIPTGIHLDEDQTHVHIEARVNWDKKNIPKRIGISLEVSL